MEPKQRAIQIFHSIRYFWPEIHRLWHVLSSIKKKQIMTVIEESIISDRLEKRKENNNGTD